MMVLPQPGRIHRPNHFIFVGIAPQDVVPPPPDNLVAKSIVDNLGRKNHARNVGAITELGECLLPVFGFRRAIVNDNWKQPCFLNTDCPIEGCYTFQVPRSLRGDLPPFIEVPGIGTQQKHATLISNFHVLALYRMTHPIPHRPAFACPRCLRATLPAYSCNSRRGIQRRLES
jgi:hypothetical protein